MGHPIRYAFSGSLVRYCGAKFVTNRLQSSACNGGRLSREVVAEARVELEIRRIDRDATDLYLCAVDLRPQSMDGHGHSREPWPENVAKSIAQNEPLVETPYFLR